MSPKKPTNQHTRPTQLTVDMGKLIKTARVEADMTQAELAEKIRRRQASLSDIENGKMEVDAGTLVQLAGALQKPITYFFPSWIRKILQPEEVTPEEEELLIQAKRLSRDELRMITTQVRALAEIDQRKYAEWIDEQFEADATNPPRPLRRK